MNDCQFCCACVCSLSVCTCTLNFSSGRGVGGQITRISAVFSLVVHNKHTHDNPS
ncbi:hypothetical protein EXN66_Car004112 [Channa argus]|uniref:Uncharacterized protein n=1 Tax=Channa argus TaxID=215402 RepID=A0A6G1PDQ3_CHAAH|nr:hypothetical protein EXN66_Car004112 [Channa argus]